MNGLPVGFGIIIRKGLNNVLNCGSSKVDWGLAGSSGTGDIWLFGFIRAIRRRLRYRFRREAWVVLRIGRGAGICISICS